MQVAFAPFPVEQQFARPTHEAYLWAHGYSHVQQLRKGRTRRHGSDAPKPYTLPRLRLNNAHSSGVGAFNSVFLGEGFSASNSKYPPAKPGALSFGPLKAA